ncbi:MAG: M20/M25/M40 family metallo-hydrolase [Thermoproteota archaeon]
MEGKKYEYAFRKLKLLEDWGKNLLLDIIAIPTISPEGKNYKELVDLVKEKLESQGLRAEVHRVPDDVVRSKGPAEAHGNPRYILISRSGTGGPVFHMNCHYDVVPGGPGWTVTAPFKPMVKDGKVYARGSTDTKGGAASALMALTAFSDLKDIEGSMEVALVPDEEVGGECGTIYMLDAGLSKPDFSRPIDFKYSFCSGVSFPSLFKFSK